MGFPYTVQHWISYIGDGIAAICKRHIGIAEFLCGLAAIITRHCRDKLYCLLQPFWPKVRFASHCSPTVLQMSAIGFSRQFRVKFCAATLQLRTCIAEQRPAKAKEHTKALLAWVAANKSISTAADKLGLQELVTTMHTEVWPTGCLAELLAAVEDACLKRRRPSQNWGTEILNVFTADELDRWTKAGLAGMNEIAMDLVARMKSLGGKNLSEPDKKLLTAIWLHFRGDGVSLGRIGRQSAKSSFLALFSRSMKSFEPEAYMETLPPMGQLSTSHPEVYMAAYDEEPVRMPAKDVSQIMLLDHAMSCRGLGFEIAAPQVLHAPRLPSPAPALPSPASGELGVLGGLLQLLQQMSGAPGGAVPGLTIYGDAHGGGQPTSNPMRGRNALANHPANFRRAVTVEDVVAGETPRRPALLDGRVDEAAAGAGDALESVRKRMLARGTRSDRSDAPRGDDAPSESEEDASASLPSPPKKCKARKKPKSTTPKKAAKAKKTTATPCKKKKAPSFSVEHSRKQAMCRTGGEGPGSTYRISFDECGGKAKAIAKAKAWVAKGK